MTTHRIHRYTHKSHTVFAKYQLSSDVQTIEPFVSGECVCACVHSTCTHRNLKNQIKPLRVFTREKKCESTLL